MDWLDRELESEFHISLHFTNPSLTPQTQPLVPAVAVASGSHIYIYKNMRPYFKFTLPTLDIHPQEKELWTRAEDAELGHLCDGLQSLRAEIGDVRLTARTQKLLMLNDRQEAQVRGEIRRSCSVRNKC
jgi:hypothetical protein